MTKKLTTSEATEGIPASKAPNVVALQPKPPERRQVFNHGYTHRYTMVVGRKRIACEMRRFLAFVGSSLRSNR